MPFELGVPSSLFLFRFEAKKLQNCWNPNLKRFFHLTCKKNKRLQSFLSTHRVGPEITSHFQTLFFYFSGHLCSRNAKHIICIWRWFRQAGFCGLCSQEPTKCQILLCARMFGWTISGCHNYHRPSVWTQVSCQIIILSNVFFCNFYDLVFFFKLSYQD